MLQLSDDYSDPYDLRKQGAVVTAVVHEPVEVKVVPRTDTSEGDYSVPYDLKNRNKGISCNDHFFYLVFTLAPHYRATVWKSYNLMSYFKLA